MNTKRRSENRLNPEQPSKTNAKIRAEERIHTSPQNWVIRRFLDFRYRIGLAISAPNAEEATEIERERGYSEQHQLAEQYSEGYLAGWRECYAACLTAVEDEVSKSGDIWRAGSLLASSDESLKAN